MLCCSGSCFEVIVKVILFDEPTASLDSETCLEIVKIIQDIHIKYPL